VVNRSKRFVSPLVPKLYLGTHLSAKLCFASWTEATKLRGHSRSQVQLGNEERSIAQSAQRHSRNCRTWGVPRQNRGFTILIVQD